MTDWSEPTSDEILSNLKNEIDRITNLPMYYCHKPEDFGKLLNQIEDKNYNQIIINPGVYKYFAEAKDKTFLGKLKYGWRLFALSWSDWKDAMVSEDYVEEFFEYLGNCEIYE
jgi:hypothetical protein